VVPLQGKAAGHDKTDIPAAEDDTLPGGQLTQQVGKMLGTPGSKDPGRAGAMDGDLLGSPLPAGGGEARPAGQFCRTGGISGELRARLKNFFSDSPTASLHSGDTLCYTVKKLDFSCDKEADVCFAS